MSTAAIAAIDYALHLNNCEMDFLQLWRNGDVDMLRRAFPDCPDECIAGKLTVGTRVRMLRDAGIFWSRGYIGTVSEVLRHGVVIVFNTSDTSATAIRSAFEVIP